jgi:HEAT repeat protein
MTKFMREVKTWVAVVATLAGLIVLPGFGSRRTSTGPDANVEQTIAHHIAALRAGTAQQKAASAYWLGQQHSSAAEAVNPLTDLLADKTEVDASRYRQAARDSKPTLGEEAAAALVQIGRPSIPPLIRILKTSPSPEARKNAAWALGALHESSAGEAPPSALNPRAGWPRA